MTSPVTAQRSDFVVAELAPSTAGRELVSQKNSIPGERALDALLDAGDIGATHAKNLRVGSLVWGTATFGGQCLGGIIGSGFGVAMYVSLALMGTVAALGVTNITYGFWDGRKRVSQLADLPRGREVVASPIEQAAIAEASARCIDATKLLGSKAWRREIAGTPDRPTEHAELVKLVFSAFYDYDHQMRPARDIDERMESLLFALRKCPAEEQPALRTIVEKLVRRTKATPHAQLSAALAGEPFRYADKLKKYRPEGADTPLTHQEQVAVAEIDFVMKKHATDDAVRWGRSVVDTIPAAMRVAAHFEAAGLRASIESIASEGGGSRYSVVAYEDGKDPGVKLHRRNLDDHTGFLCDRPPGGGGCG